jgi:hypothetical protein
MSNEGFDKISLNTFTRMDMQLKLNHLDKLLKEIRNMRSYNGPIVENFIRKAQLVISKIHGQDSKFIKEVNAMDPDNFRGGAWQTTIVSALERLHIEIQFEPHQDETKSKNVRRVKPTRKMLIRLQKEINSQCPFCNNEEVEHFDVHHIDKDSSNTVFVNLILLCKNCHAKADAGDITKEQIFEIKNQKERFTNIGCDISIDRGNCSWESIKNIHNAFQLTKGILSTFPVLRFHFINHTEKTIVLRSVELNVKHLFSGMSGLPRPSTVHRSEILELVVENSHALMELEETQIPSKHAYTLCLRILEKSGGEYFVPDSRQILQFSFKFNNGVDVLPPRVMLNTDNETEGIPLVVMC